MSPAASLCVPVVPEAACSKSTPADRSSRDPSHRAKRIALQTQFSAIRCVPSIYERYREWDIERAFQTSKSLFATRPIFHKLDDTIRGHVSCSFLALVMKKELEERIANLGLAGSRPDILADLNSLTETEVEQDGKRFLLRTPPRPAASLALRRAAGVALPLTVRQLADA